MKLKFFSHCCLVIALATALAGCNSGGDGSTTDVTISNSSNPVSVVTISGRAGITPIVGGSVTIKDLSGSSLGTGVTSDDGSYAIDVNDDVIAGGYELVVTGGSLSGLDFTDSLSALYSQDDLKDQANVTYITTLIESLSSDEGTLSISKRNQVLQQLSDMGLVNDEEWFLITPEFVDIEELDAVVLTEGVSSWVSRVTVDLEDSQIEAANMRVFINAHDGILEALTVSRVMIYPGDTKTVIVGGETVNNASDTDVSISLNGESPDWVSIVDNTLVIAPPEDEAVLQTKMLTLNVNKGSAVVGREVSLDVSILKKIVLLEGSIGIEGGTLFNDWKDISLKFNPNVLEQEHYFTLTAGQNDIGAISTKLTAVPPLSEGEQTGMNLFLPAREVLRNNYFSVTDSEAESISSRATSQDLQHRTVTYDSNYMSESVKKICVDNEIVRMDGFIFDNIWRATANNYDTGLLTGSINGGEPRSVNGTGDEMCSTRLWSTNLIGESSLLASTKEPVLLVHGFIKSGKLGSMDGAVYFSKFASVLQSSDKYMPFEFEWRTNASFTDVAVDLRKSVQMIAERTGKQVHIVAHSFGGVLSRSMVQLGYNSKAFSEKNIASITTVGSPHSGVFDGPTIRDGVFKAKIDNSERSFTFGDTDIVFLRGQDGLAGSLIDACRAITCYQTGDSVSFLNNDSAFNKYGVLKESGSVVYRLASTISEYPEVPTQVLIGLVSDSQGISSEGFEDRTRNGKLVYKFTPRLGSVSGDDLISDNGQRVNPSGQFGVYQGDEESKNNIEEHVLHFKLVDDDDNFERDAYDYLLTVFDNSFAEGYSRNYTSNSTFYDHTIIKDPSDSAVYLRENQHLSIVASTEGLILQYPNLAKKYVVGSNHRTGQYKEIKNSNMKLARLSEVGLQDCTSSEDCFNPTWLYFKTFASTHPSEAIDPPEKIVLSGDVMYLNSSIASRNLQNELSLSNREEIPFPVTVEAYTGDVFSLLGLNERTTLNTDGTYELDVPYEPDTKYSVIAYPEGDTLARVGAFVRASASKFLTTFSTLEESTLHFPTITLTDGNYEEGDLTIEVRDGTSATVLNGFNLLVLNSSQTTVDDIDGVDTGYITTQPKGDYTVKVSKDGYNDGEAECTVLPDESVNCIVNIISGTQLANGEITAVLSWGETPSDLDSHLVRRTDGVQDYHVYYGSSSSEDANLDVDDTSSYGPETISIDDVKQDSQYTYYIHNFSGGAGSILPNSGAKVELNFEGGQRTFYVPNQEGIYWKVFDINEGRIIPCVSDCVKDDTSTYLNRSSGSNRGEWDIFNNLLPKD